MIISLSKFLTFSVTFITFVAPIEPIAPILGQEPPCNRLSHNVPQLRTDLAPNLRPPLGFRPLLFRQPSMCSLCGRDPGTSLLGPRSSRAPSVISAAGSTLHRGLFAWLTRRGLCATTCSGPIGPKARDHADCIALPKLHLNPIMSVMI